MCPRSIQIIPGLLRKINSLENQIPSFVDEDFKHEEPTEANELEQLIVSELFKIKMLVVVVLFIGIVLLFKWVEDVLNGLKNEITFDLVWLLLDSPM